MIPYVALKTIPIGPVTIQVWGLFVALGIVVGLLVARRAAVQRGGDPEVMADMVARAVLAGIIGARLGHVLLYDPSRYLADPMAVLRLWEGGMSMFGAFIGGGLMLWRDLRRNGPVTMAYLDAAAFAFPCGYGIGRIGCFLIHDHPGTLSDSLVAVRYPDGPRYDHGLMLSLVGFAIFGWFWWRARRLPDGKQGGFLARLMLSYGMARFVLDFLRASDLPGSDARYLALTPAQWLSLVLIGTGTALLVRERRIARAAPHAL